MQYPYTTRLPTIGDVISGGGIPEGQKHVVIDGKIIEEGWQITTCKLDEDFSYSIHSIKVYYCTSTNIELVDLLLGEVKVHAKMRRMSHNENAVFEMIDRDTLGEFVPGMKYTHADKFGESHPLRTMKYWNAPGGKNLTIIACLEWALVHLQKCHEELFCNENVETITYLEKAIKAQKHRHDVRTRSGVLGTNKPHPSMPGPAA